MVKAVLVVLSEPFNFDLVVERFKSYGIKNSAFQVCKTPENSAVTDELIRILGFTLTSYVQLNVSGKPPPLNKSREDKTYEYIQTCNKVIFIESLNSIEKILARLAQGEESIGLNGEIGVFITGELGKYGVNLIRNVEMIGEEGLSMGGTRRIDLELLKIAQKEVFHGFNNYVKTRISNYEKMRTNGLEIKFALPKTFKTIEKVQKALKSSEVFSKASQGTLTNYSEISENCENAKKILTFYNKRLESILNSSKSSHFPIDFSSIQIPITKYTSNMVSLSEEQSENNANHIFTIENLTEYSLNDLKIYESDANDEILSFSLSPREKVTLVEDFLLEKIKYNGFINFQVYYCTFPVSPSIETPSISILSVNYKAGQSKLDVNFHSHIQSCNEIQIMLNDISVFKNFKTKNFQKSFVEINVQGFKGEGSLYMMAKGKRISNEWRLIIE